MDEVLFLMGPRLETRGNTTEMPREVNFLAIAREFCGNENRNPEWGHVSFL
jgi:hypothetical protein